jgi:hypothetical protein
MNKFDNLKEFEILNIGMLKGISGGCGSDNDRLCNGWCPTAGCAHDGCCGANYDARGDAACKTSGKEAAHFLKI